VTIDHVPHLQIPAKIAAEIATQSGHDIVQLVGSGTEKWAAALADVQDVCDKIGKKHGGFTPLAENYCKTANGKFHSVPDFFIDFPGLYRKDLWSEIGMPNGPDSWEDLRTGGAKLKAKGFPVGIGLAHHDDSRASWRAIMWSFGASEVAKDGKTLTYNSKEMRETLKFLKALYKETMTPEVLAWDDASNNRLLASGRGSWIHNPISAYRTIEGQNKELADKIHIQLSPKGPAGRLSFANCLAYGITKFSPNQDTAKLFIEGLTDNFKDAFKASTGYNNPFLKTYAKGPLPIISEDPKLKVLEKSPEYHYTIGYPGPLTVPADEVYQQFVLIDAAAQFCTDKMDVEQTIKWGEDKLKAIYSKFV
jgi:multiple sugar transport system substrate-binding protein